MIAKSRCHTVDVTSHEKLLLAFYRSMPLAQQQDIDGLLFSSWSLPIVHERWRQESRTLGVGTLTAAHISPFADASIGLVGVQRRLP